MKKQTKVLVAAALLTLGASFSAMAAQKGTWELVDGEWYCYDEDGDVYENEWCSYNGKEYYVGDDGVMVTSSWVEDGAYYVNSEGLKVTNQFRLLVPFEDEEAEEVYFYFGSTGKKVTDSKKVIDGKTYYFNNEGVMQTGWVDKSTNDEAESIDNAVYCDEDGARVKNAWVKTYEPGIDPEEDDVDDDDMYWYYIGSAGAAKTGKQANIDGATYFFGADGKMLSGWVASGSDAYFEINDSEADGINGYAAVYFCGDSEDGHAKKNTWIKEYRNTKYDDQDADNSKYWFWIEKNGKVFVGSEDALAATPVSFEDGEVENPLVLSEEDAYTAYEKKINGETYIFNAAGEMKSGLISYNDKVYYYGGGSDGAKKDGSQSIADDAGNSYKFYFSTEDDSDEGYYDYAGVTGAKNGKLYKDGLLVTSKDDKYEEVEIDDVYYLVNKSGSIQTSKKEYKEDGEVCFDATNTTFNTTAGVLKGSYTTSIAK